MAWLMLAVAGVLEVGWAYTMKLSDGFSRPLMTVCTLILMVSSFGLLSAAMKTIPLGTAYAIWTGIGPVGAFIVGILFLSEYVMLLRVVAVVLIASGLILLKVSSSR